ncbi:MAG TPA: hypothetical protein VFP36_13935, partial [Usitatibacter sp.]|nr:hypothetical protein [Usitatibacter sp.]
MKTRKMLCALAAAAAFASVPAFVFAGQSHSQHPQAHQLTLDKGGKWKIDEPLRTGMESIRDQVTQMHLAGERAPLKTEWYRSLGLSIQQEIAAIVKNCQLDPQADANFHILLAQLDEAAEALKRNTAGDARRGMKQARETLEHYGRYFDHPGWS